MLQDFLYNYVFDENEHPIVKINYQTKQNKIYYLDNYSLLDFLDSYRYIKLTDLYKLSRYDDFIKVANIFKHYGEITIEIDFIPSSTNLIIQQIYYASLKAYLYFFESYKLKCYLHNFTNKSSL